MSPHLAHWLEALLGMVYILMGKGQPRSPWGWELEGSILLGPAWESYTHGHRKDAASQSKGSDRTPRGAMPGSLRCVHGLQETQKFLRVLVKETKVQRGLLVQQRPGSERGGLPGLDLNDRGHDSGSKH